jgi:hypothetical protein
VFEGISHCIAFSQAVIVEPQPNTSVWNSHLGISCNTPRVDCHCILFFIALIAASQLNKSSCRNLLGISYSNPRAVSHNMPFAHALIAALQLITCGWTTHLDICCNI